MIDTKPERDLNEVATLLNVSPNILRRWKTSGLLMKAPDGEPGRDAWWTMHWCDAAVEEARRVKSAFVILSVQKGATSNDIAKRLGSKALPPLPAASPRLP